MRGREHMEMIRARFPMVRRKWGFMMERSVLEFVPVHLYPWPAWVREGGENTGDSRTSHWCKKQRIDECVLYGRSLSSFGWWTAFLTEKNVSSETDQSHYTYLLVQPHNRPAFGILTQTHTHRLAQLWGRGIDF